MSPASRATQADPVARMLLAGSRLSAPQVMEWEARCGGFVVLPCRCTATVGRRPRVSQLPRGFVTRLLPTVPKHPMQSLWHAIEPEFFALGVAPVSQDRRRGAGSNPSPPTDLSDLHRWCTAAVGRGLGACEPPIGLVSGSQPAVPSHPCWGAYPFSSKVSVACGQQLDWCGVRHTRELCGDADPRGHLRESYAPSFSIKSTSDLDRPHMPWGYLEHNKSMSPLGAANNHVRLRQISTLMTTPFSTPPFGGGPISSSIRCGQQLDWRGVSHTRECEPADT